MRQNAHTPLTTQRPECFSGHERESSTLISLHSSRELKPSPPQFMTLRMEVFAVSKVPAGSEVTIEYVPGLITQTWEERRKALYDSFGFDKCLCQVCSAPPSEIAKSDARRREIKKLSETLEGAKDREATLAKFERIRILLEDEGFKGLPAFCESLICCTTYRVSHSYIKVLVSQRIPVLRALSQFIWVFERGHNGRINKLTVFFVKRVVCIESVSTRKVTFVCRSSSKFRSKSPHYFLSLRTLNPRLTIRQSGMMCLRRLMHD